jgi:hypothetical protein
MLRRTVAMVILMFMASVLVSGALLSTPAARGPTNAPAAAPAEPRAAVAARNPKRDRKHERKKAERRQDRKQQDRAADRKHKDRQYDRAQRRTDVDTPQYATEPGRVGDWREFCTGPETVRLPRVELCTHGPDPAPPGFDVEVPVEPLSVDSADVEAATVACDGDGQSGFRVQVLYVRDAAGTPLDPQLETSIRTWSGEADEIFRQSAAETGGNRGLRFVHGAGPDCQPIVSEVEVSTSGLSSIGAMIGQLAAQNLNREDRIYLAFVNATRFCGVGTVAGDDTPTLDNWNNVGPSYARVDAGCWGGFVAAHEVMHNLGGVQPGAPNATPGFHCVDEWDVMCYSDQGGGNPPMTFACQPQTPYAWRFDCNDDAYFHTNPAPETYLANHWNPANNQFLTNAKPLAAPPPPPPPPPAPAIEPPPADDTSPPAEKKNKKKKHKSKHKKGNGKNRKH